LLTEDCSRQSSALCQSLFDKTTDALTDTRFQKTKRQAPTLSYGQREKISGKHSLATGNNR
ncbi:hypothetical protein, partial [Thiolapillus sp.]|uniref:hypothetical protein n=1 Tax=Thiolapillus sp. TaxID=2017437 RepID=UPI003AF6416D